MKKLDKTIGELIKENMKKLGIKPIHAKSFSEKEQAENLRKHYIDFYENHHIHGFCGCFEKQKQDMEYNLKAYEIMTDKQVLMSEKRSNKLERELFDKRWKKLKEFQEHSRKVMENDKTVYRNVI